MDLPIKILHLEDNLSDAELIRVELSNTYTNLELTQVANEHGFIEALKQEQFDIVLSDYNLMGFEGILIYDTFKKMKKDIPFIFVSGTIGEEKAVDLLRDGVTDYVTKQNLGKLSVAINRAIKEYRASKQLIEKEQFLTNTLNSLSGHIAVVNHEGKIITTNDSWDDFAAKHKDIVSIKNAKVGENYLELVQKIAQTDNTIQKIYDGILKVSKGQLNYFYLDYPCHLPKEIKWYTLRAMPLKGSKNIIISHANITDRVLAEKEVLYAYEKLELISNNIGEIVYKVKLIEGNTPFVEYISNNVIEVIGFSAQDYIHGNPDLTKSMKPERYKEAIAFNQKVRSSKVSKQYVFEYEWYHPIKKEWKWLRETLVPEIVEGKVIGQFGKVTDITEHKETQKRMQISETKYESLFNKMKEGLLYSDPKGKILLVNPAFCEMFGYSEDELLGKNGYDFLSPQEERKNLKDKIKEREKGNSGNYEANMLTKKGDLITVSISASPQFNDDKEFTGVMSVITDISERKSIEILLKEREERFRSLIEYSSEITCVVDAKGVINFISPSVTASLGYIENELVGQNIFELISPEHYKKAKENYKACLSNDSNIKYDVYLVKKKQKGYAYLRAILTNHIDKKGINGFIINAQDVTEFIKSEKDKFFNILKAEENERTRIAHDLHDGLGQTIAAANMSMNALDHLMKNQLDEEVYSVFETGKELVSQATKETRMVSHNIMPRSLKEYGIEESVRGMVNNYQNINNDIKFDFKSNLKDKRFSKEIELTCFRVMQEAINNAVKYSKSPIINIEIRLLGKRLFIDVKDNGIGFKVDEKKDNNHSGLGMTSMANRISTIGGDLKINSKLNEGTHVSVMVRLDNNHFEEFLQTN